MGTDLYKVTSVLALVPVTEDLCIHFIPKKCPVGYPVVALFPVPAACGCNGKRGSIESKRFYSLNHLLKFSAENRKRKTNLLFLNRFYSFCNYIFDIYLIFLAFLSWSYTWPV